ncbi:DNA topoisomerase 4 subunit A [uncultured Gammaproteobacteria bacterium]
MKPPIIEAEILDKPFAEALGERYLSYALSTIMSRSLPDVRDGLKPVHRRLMHAMNQLRLAPTTPPRKCARVVGEVIGRYHPHGDVAVYEALVRLAQDFAVRYPLIDGQGNFGNIDGDNAAAMRYTEARLTEVAKALLDGIDEDSVDFRGTYDGDGTEPVVLPAAFPNLLANGATGIAVGMATSIPPHNVHELCDALRLLIKNPEASIESLVALVPGPDFPTGGILVEPRNAVLEAYRTGRGGFRLRARWMVEKLAQGMWRIVVTEIPYQVRKSVLIERIAELLGERKLPFLEDVRDESADDVRLVLVPRTRLIDPEVLMASLFQATDLEVRFPLNLNVLDATNVPRVMNLRAVLRAFLDHRHVVLQRRTRYRLERIERRLEVLDGFLIVYLNLDEVIRIIRYEDHPKDELMRVFILTDIQAEAILDMKLRNLRKLEEVELRREHLSLAAEREKLRTLMGDDNLRWAAINDEIGEIKKKFGKATVLGKRRTDIADAPVEIEIPAEATVERETVTVLCSEMGWIRAVKGRLGEAELAEVKYKEGDGPRFALVAETTDKLVLFAGNGRFYTLAVDKLQRGRGFGEPVRMAVDLANDANILTLLLHRPGRRLVVASEDGRGFQVEESEVLAQTRAGKQVLNLEDGIAAKLCVPVGDNVDTVAVIGNNRKLLFFPLEELPVMTRGRGVVMQKYKDGSLADLTLLRLADGFSWKMGERIRTETDLRPWQGARAGSGRLPPNGFPRSGLFS